MSPRLLPRPSLALCGRAAALAALAPLAPAAPRAQEFPAPETCRIRVWTTADGLPQGTVNEVLQGPDGGLWIATFGGLVRFDGREFASTDLESLEDLPSNRFTSLALDGRDGVWAAQQSGELLRFEHGLLRETVEPPPERIEVVSLVRDPRGVLWVRASSGSVHRRGPDGWSRCWTRASEPGFESLVVAGDGTVAFASRDELVSLDEQGRVAASRRAAGPILALASDGDTIWIGHASGVARLRAGALEEVPCEPPVREVSALIPDGEGGLWLGAGSSVRHALPDGAGGLRARPAPEGLPTRFEVRSLGRDREGNLWVGAHGQGLARLTLHRFARLGAGYADGTVSALASDGEGGAWIAYDCDGLAHLARGAREPQPVALRRPDGKAPCVQSLVRDRRGRVWAGVQTRLWRGEGGTFAPVEAAGAYEPRVGPIVELEDGSVCVASTGGRVVRLDERDAPELLFDVGETVVSMSGAPGGVLWVGGVGVVWRSEGGPPERFGRENGIPRGDVRDLLPEPDGAWIATYGGGLARLVRHPSGRATSISRADGLPDPSLSRLLDDGRGRLWMLSNRGLIVAERAELEALLEGRVERVDPPLFGPELGMPEANFGSPAGFSDASGAMWFGTLAGAVRVDPRELPVAATAPPVRIERLLVDDVAFDPARVGEIPSGRRRLVVEYDAPTLTAPEHVRFRYRLRGLDERWYDAGAERRAAFTALPHGGPYTFEVAARREDGVWGDRTASLSLTVLPAWWERADVRIAGAFAAAAALIAWHRRRIAAIDRRTRALLEATEGRARAEEAQSRLRDQLAHVARVATAGELATTLAHEVNQPIAAIVANAMAGRRLHARGNLAGTELDELLRDIEQQGQRASGVVARLREFLRKHAAERKPLDLSSAAREALPFVRREVEDHRVSLELALAAGLPPVLADPVQAQQVVVNLVQNACEALEAWDGPRRITVRTRAEAGRVLLSVEDSGPGLAPEVEGRLFEPWVTTKPEGMGLGLSICRSIVEAHGGRLSARPRAGGGLVMLVDLPAAERADLESRSPEAAEEFAG